MGRMNRYTLLTACLVGMLGFAAATPAQAEVIVRFHTVLGDIDVELFAQETPQTVDNFLNYVLDDDYVNTFFHRSARLFDGTPFVLQGGGYVVTNNDPLALNIVPDKAPVINEPGISNLRGTIAMAKIGPPQGQDPTPESINSATNQWFFNLGDNSANLNNQNGGFTVFGQVLGNGMDVVDAIAALPVFDGGGAFSDIPLINYPGTVPVIGDNLAVISSIEIIENTSPEVPEPGTLGVFGLGLLALPRRTRRA